MIEYAPSKRGQPGDRLFVPTDQLDQVTRYVGGEAPDAATSWAARDWAEDQGPGPQGGQARSPAELIRLYSARMASPGFAFGPDTPWQRELEDAFPYVETPDQLAAIDEVKADMEQPVPMDRLICGDVGYGKTEIAVRAAFKAVQDGKQVAVLVPTTLLVQQHIADVHRALRQLPGDGQGAVAVPDATRRPSEVMDGLADGTVDVVIGTHRLLASEVRFKDLGLVVVDEEQRFGVEHKEQLKALRTGGGRARDERDADPAHAGDGGHRHPRDVDARHAARGAAPGADLRRRYDEKQIAAAIRRELLREGQVFYVHNRVELDRAGRRAGCASWCPRRGSRRRTARWASTRSSRSCSTSGRRSSTCWSARRSSRPAWTSRNANTLIVERADVLGLSQLHQLRGRVGRGRERAYAYFLYPPEKPLTETAHDRLQTIAQHTDLGAGMQVAMKDLEIRGAGNLLGGEQSGHIAGRRLRPLRPAGRRGGRRVPGRRPRTAPAEVKIELPVDAHLPHDYVPGGAAAPGGVPEARLGARRRGGSTRSAAELRRPLRRAADAGREPARGRPAARARPPGRPHRRRAAGQARAVRARSSCARASSCGSPACTPARWSSRRCGRPGAGARRPPGSVAGRCATARSYAGHASWSTPCCSTAWRPRRVPPPAADAVRRRACDGGRCDRTDRSETA